MAADHRRICQFFARGNCSYGSNCKYRHAQGGSPAPVDSAISLPCRYFNTARGCQNGNACAFAHTKDISQPNGQTPNSEIDNSFRRWCYLIPRDDRPSRPLHQSQLAQFFRQAYDLVGSDVGTRQAVITKLASEGGLRHMKDVIDFVLDNDGTGFQRGKPSHNTLMYLLCTVGNKDVLSSMILENDVGRICNFLFGPSGRRAIQLFGSIAAFLNEDNNTTHDNANGLESSAFFVSVLALFSVIVDLNGTAPIIDDLSTIGIRLATYFERFVSNASTDFNSALEAQTHLLKIQRRLKIGESIPVATVAKIADSAKPEFKIHRDGPGWLSEQGARHDNDHDCITKISVMPTTEEILSPRSEYLPSRHFSELHLGGVEGLLDRQFRLLREDTIGQLRDAVRLELERQPSSNTFAKVAGRHQQAVRTNVYRNGLCVNLLFDKFEGMQILYRFDQPQTVRNMPVQDRKMWWQASKRLQPGCLVCMITPMSSYVFCFVVNSPRESKNASVNQDGALEVDVSLMQERKENNIWEHPNEAFVLLSPVDIDDRQLRLIFRQFHQEAAKASSILVEFPRVLLPAFRPTLLALQRMVSSRDVPFADIIAPSSRPNSAIIDIEPPAYARRGFRFDLSSLVHDGETLYLTVNQKFDVDALRKRSNLDEGQAIALVNALTRRLALIQGPPGTGKSFTGVAIIKVLLANQSRAKLGPLICVCYTNHALDQLLEDLVKANVQQIVRVGSQSKSDILKNLNLRDLSKQIEKTKTEKHAAWELKKTLENSSRELNALLIRLRQAGSESSIKEHLAAAHPNHHRQLFGKDEDDWQEVVYNRKTTIKAWLHKGDTNDEQIRSFSDLQQISLHEMKRRDRAILYSGWILEIRRPILRDMMSASESFAQAKKGMEKIRQELDLRVLKEASIVGVTTSGLARIVDLLGRLRSKVLVCEEAGEVLEAHTLTAFLPSIEHAILIGDHLQLRPQTQNYELQHENPHGKQYSLDVSLFERLVDPEKTSGMQVPLSTLEVQRRMHPSIASLIRDTGIYPKLRDSESVTTYPEVMGMRKRLFWLDHQNFEAVAEEGHQGSHSNDFEVEMTAALVSHLIRQGTYDSNEIAVLTPYLGQLHKLRHRLAFSFEVVVGDRDLKDLEDQGIEDTTPQWRPLVRKTSLLKTLRCATIDNFQGEEAKVVVISLVRSNPENKCGFLKTSNRVVVLLSRAQHGMYIIGNAQTSATVPLWANVISLLQQQDNFGQFLQLQCPRHAQTSIEVRTPDDFTLFAPEGGCQEKCQQRLACGHPCITKCHSEPLHNAVKCLEPCPNSLKSCDHACPAFCGDPCPSKCKVQIKSVTMLCGHVNDLPCWQSQDLAQAKCSALVEKTMSTCNHVIMVPCYQQKSIGLQCKASCNTPLICGHDCSKRCMQCTIRDPFTGEVATVSHGECQTICGRGYNTCAHSCSAQCHDGTSCPPCNAKCEIRCAHSVCEKECHQPCTPCAVEICTSRCPHSSCSMPCAAPCDWLPCSQRCQEILTCGHQCPSVCGETCPDAKFCQICGNEDIKSMQVDLILLSDYQSVDLSEDPCIFPHCGHIITISSLDGLMDMREHYHMSADGIVTGLASSSEPFSANMLKTCPICNGPLRNISRYGRIVRRGILDESTKKFNIWANRKLIQLSQEVLNEQSKAPDPAKTDLIKENIAFGGTSLDQFGLVKSKFHPFMKRYAGLINLRKQVAQFKVKVGLEEQPFTRVWELVQNMRRRQGKLKECKIDNSVLQTRFHLEASVLLLQCEFLILSKLLQENQDAPKEPLRGHISADFSHNRVQCQAVVETAREARKPRQEAEGHLLWAKYAIIERTTVSTLDSSALDRDCLRNEAVEHLKEATRICTERPSYTRGIQQEIDASEHMLRDSMFYAEVTLDERRAVLAAMATELSGTGRWKDQQHQTEDRRSRLTHSQVLLRKRTPVHRRRMWSADGIHAVPAMRRCSRRQPPHRGARSRSGHRSARRTASDAAAWRLSST